MSEIQFWCIKNSKRKYHYIKFNHNGVDITRKVSNELYSMIIKNNNYKCDKTRRTISVVNRDKEEHKYGLDLTYRLTDMIQCNKPYSKGGVNKSDLIYMSQFYGIDAKKKTKKELCTAIISKIKE